MDNNKKLWIALIIIAAVLLSGNPPEEEKKESGKEWSKTVFGVAMIAAGIVAMIPNPFWIASAPFGWTLIIAGIATLGSGLIGVFTPDPKISPLIYVAGFFILFIMVTRKKGG